MKKSELIRLLSSAEEDEVYIKVGEELYDITIGHEEAAFDGFYTLFEASVSLKPEFDEGFFVVQRYDDPTY